jgi:nitrite reductase/ring-hydroxylating ferredoxin subunit
MVRLIAAVVGAIATLFPFAAGWGVIVAPLLRARRANNQDESPSGKLVRICPLESLPADGIPRPFAVVADITDAWTHAPAQRIGAVYITRSNKNPNDVTAFTTTCPHLGCAVEFDQATSQFVCPCHKSGFAKDGQKLFGPSRRDLDPLPVKLEEKSGTMEIWVEFKQFEAGMAERKPIE